MQSCRSQTGRINCFESSCKLNGGIPYAHQSTIVFASFFPLLLHFLTALITFSIYVKVQEMISISCAWTQHQFEKHLLQTAWQRLIDERANVILGASKQDGEWLELSHGFPTIASQAFIHYMTFFSISPVRKWFIQKSLQILQFPS